jgi:hypothetical protein
MKQRILTGWNFARILYLLAGIMILIQSVADRQWMGVALGAYFVAMGLFAVGCAAGNCYYQPGPKSDSDIEDTNFEEIK